MFKKEKGKNYSKKAQIINKNNQSQRKIKF